MIICTVCFAVHVCFMPFYSCPHRKLQAASFFFFFTSSSVFHSARSSISFHLLPQSNTRLYFLDFYGEFPSVFYSSGCKIKIKIHAQQRGQWPFRAHPTVALCRGIFNVSNVFQWFVFLEGGFKDI